VFVVLTWMRLGYARELETLLRALLSMDRREFEDCLALVSDDIYLTTRQVNITLTGKAISVLWIMGLQFRCIMGLHCVWFTDPCVSPYRWIRSSGACTRPRCMRHIWTKSCLFYQGMLLHM
jgi:hypothetical protein